ncbi:transglutaminase-like cysteine peptidase [Roseobacter ponti]|uniref:Transglutaminase-like cysteine peptidase n=1 Tax=Roseobacter ponti TaxID=1891787 RepID=A0A858SWH2_9RHOB|nr:transglutaminase-like cysteine peptidase [Roseobacter ponti]QJF51993.1 transglutaminase-like cysteine peptidase [Roseobacter ponti]
MTDFAIRRSAHRHPLRKLPRLAAGLFALGLGLSLAVLPATDAHAGDGNSFLPAKMAIAAPTGARNLCGKYRWACSHSGTSGKVSQSDLRKVDQINRRVNRQIREVTDQSQYRKADYWTLPQSSRGDCEDFALLKKKELMRAGFAPQNLLLTTVLDRQGRSHAVLVVRTTAGDYVLDNLNDKVKPWKATRYTFLRMQNPRNPGAWVGVLTKA